MRKDARYLAKGIAVTCMAIGVYTLTPPISVNAAQTAGFTASMESVLSNKTSISSGFQIPETDKQTQSMNKDFVSDETGVSFSDTNPQNAGAISSIFDTIVPNNTTVQMNVQELEASADVENNAICGYTNLGIANAKCLNIYKEPKEKQALAGQLPNNAGCEILETRDNWCKVQSGDVTGWTKSEYLLTGEAAEKRAEEVMTVKATANTDGINMREEPNTDCDIHATLDEGKTVNVTENLGEWVKIKEQENESYVSADLVDISESLPVAKTIEEIDAEKKAKEKAEREAKEKAEREAKEKAEREAKEKAEREAKEKKIKETRKENNSNKKPVKEKEHKVSVSKNVSKTRVNLVNYALRFVGNPYVWGGTSLTHGTDCSGFTMKVYEKYGISLPHHAASQAGHGKSINASQMRPGDLIFYSRGGGINHVALYIGKGKVVHASNPRTGIKISTYNYRTPVKIISLLK